MTGFLCFFFPWCWQNALWLSNDVLLHWTLVTVQSYQPSRSHSNPAFILVGLCICFHTHSIWQLPKGKVKHIILNLFHLCFIANTFISLKFLLFKNMKVFPEHHVSETSNPYILEILNSESSKLKYKTLKQQNTYLFPIVPLCLH